jgi:membrane-associated phospholipid phosphatase
MPRFFFLLPFSLGIGLFLSWLLPETRLLWDHLDFTLFSAFNTSLGASHWWQIFWAVLNFRGADAIPAFIVMGLFAHYVFTHARDRRMEYAAIGLMMAFYVVIAMQCAHALFDDIDRKSPTEVLSNVYLLSELVPWAHPKDRSDNSFPGDHGAVLLMVSAFLWYYTTRRYGLIAFAVTSFFVLPRLFSGAHWFTDIAVGSVSIALVAMSVAIGTPLHRWLSFRTAAIIRSFLPQKTRKS